MVPVREITKEMSKRAVGVLNKSKTNNGQLSGKEILKIRSVNEKDFMEALKKVKRTGEAARNFLQRENSSTDSISSATKKSDLTQAMQIMNYMMAASKHNEKEEDDDDDDDDDVPSLN